MSEFLKLLGGPLGLVLIIGGMFMVAFAIHTLVSVLGRKWRERHYVPDYGSSFVALTSHPYQSTNSRMTGLTGLTGLTYRTSSGTAQAHLATGGLHCTDCGKAMTTKIAQDGFKDDGTPYYAQGRQCPDARGGYAQCGNRVTTTPYSGHIHPDPTQTQTDCGACIDQMLSDGIINAETALDMYAKAQIVSISPGTAAQLKAISNAWTNVSGAYIPPSITNTTNTLP